jgi:hypothetical protein
MKQSDEKAGKIIIETEFAKCVKEIGGQVLDELLKQPKFKNADYWFPKHNTVAELKRLEENLLEKPDFQNKITEMYSSWVKRGLMPKIRGKIKFDLSQIPEKCAYEYIEVVKKRIENSIVRKANKQIRETKEYLGESTAKGLLIIANDGNKLLKPDFMAHLLARILKNYSNINSVIYFSANLAVSLPIPAFKMSSNSFWLDCILEREPAPKELRDNLQIAWMRHYSKLFPETPILEILIPNEPEIVEKIDFV